MATKDFIVTWKIDADDCKTPIDAARHALAIQRNPESIATFFEVEDKETGERFEVDLFEGEMRNSGGSVIKKFKSEGTA